MDKKLIIITSSDQERLQTALIKTLSDINSWIKTVFYPLISIKHISYNFEKKLL